MIQCEQVVCLDIEGTHVANYHYNKDLLRAIFVRTVVSEHRG